MLKVLSIVLLINALAFSSAQAHQQKAAITKVLFNANTQHIEIMHRFYLHDAEHAIGQIFGHKEDILNSQETQQKFSDYVAKKFTLKSDQSMLPLNKVGFEVDGKFFWVYQETPEPVVLTQLSIEHNALRDIWPEQENLVNIEGKEKIKSLNFTGTAELLSVTFDKSKYHHR